MNFTTTAFNQAEDIYLLCITVSAFPNGIKEAFEELENEYKEYAQKGYYGISWMENGVVIYKAAAAVEKETAAKSYEQYTLKSGSYLSITIHNWMQQIHLFKEAFTYLMKEPNFDDGFPCVEWYKSDEEVLCMVRLKK